MCFACFDVSFERLFLKNNFRSKIKSDFGQKLWYDFEKYVWRNKSDDKQHNS